LLFTGPVVGRAEEASDFYLSVFKGSRRGVVARYPKGMEPDKEGAIMFTDFALGGQWLAAMDSAHDHKFGFNEAVSLLISCKTQKEIDYYWDRLSPTPRPSNAAGSRTSSACPGRSTPSRSRR
jgi:predicted 3-demethylubiquinone-9 3-methyltransferase (glyoxalase superfamily)